MIKKLLRVLSCFALLALFGGAWVWFEVRSAPAWYAPADPESAAVAEMAESVEYGLVEAFHKIREPNEPWTIELDEEQINAWLVTRLNEWLEHDQEMNWPNELSAPQVHFGEKGLELAIEVTPPRPGSRSQLVVTRLVPRVENGGVAFDLDRVGLGRLSVPGASAGKLAELMGDQGGGAGPERAGPGRAVGAGFVAPAAGSGAAGPGGAASKKAAAEKGEAMVQRALSALGDGRALDSMLQLSDGRRVEVLDLTMIDGHLQMTSRTLAAEQ